MMQGASAFSHTLHARQLVTSGSYGRAFDLYLTAVELRPELKTRVEREFRRLLERYNRYLLALGRAGDVILTLERAATAFPHSAHILNDVATYLYRLGHLREACAHFQRALSLDAAYVTAEKNLNSVKNLIVERWHFRMINDRVRNSAFRKALLHSISPMEDTVLDVGTGTGLLAIYAHQCGPIMITACDCSESMVELARYVFEANGVDNLILINKLSTQASFRDMGGTKSLVVTELFDAGLFGEHVLQTLIHARENLMAVNGRIIPSRAELFVAGADSNFLASKYRLNASALSLLNIPDKKVHWLSGEPYDTEDIANIKDLQFVTDVESILKIDFNNLDDMKDKLDESSIYEVDFKAKQSGTVNVLISWFNLYLNDNIMITTNPLEPGRAKAWQQAVFYDFEPHLVSTDQSVSFQFTSCYGKLSLANSIPDNVEFVSADVIRFLNDEEYIKLISNSIAAICIYLCQINEVSCLNLLDFCPFPVLGLLMLKRGAESLTCCAKTPQDREFMNNVFIANSISLSKVTILLEDDLSLDTFEGQKFHILYLNINDLSGDIDCKRRELMKQLRNSSLFPGGLVLPHKVLLLGQLITSDWLQTINKVDDDNTFVCSIAEFINKYQVSQNLYIDIAHLDYEPLSRVATIANCVENIPSEVINVEVTESGEVNAVICWYKIQLIENGDIISTDRGQSFVDCMAYLADPTVKVTKGDVGNILCCTDIDESFKLLIDVDAD